MNDRLQDLSDRLDATLDLVRYLSAALEMQGRLDGDHYDRLLRERVAGMARQPGPARLLALQADALAAARQARLRASTGRQ